MQSLMLKILKGGGRRFVVDLIPCYILSSNKNFMLRIVLLTGRLHQINENTQEYIYAW